MNDSLKEWWKIPEDDIMHYLMKISDEDLLKINDNAVVNKNRDLLPYIKSEIYARWVSEKENIAVKEEKEKNLKNKEETL